MAYPDHLPNNDVACRDQLCALRDDLEAQESVIERGLQSFIEIGRALTRIRDDRLYRQEYVSFEAYCQTRWNLSRKRAYDLMSAATVVDGMEAALDMVMSPIGDTPALPVNEAQARELVGLSPDEAVEVMREASEATDGKPTASAIREARSPKPAVRDDDPLVDADPEPNPYERIEIAPGITADELAELNVPTVEPERPQQNSRAQNRKPLEDQFFRAIERLNPAVAALKKLGEDDRLPRNKEKIARYRNDLLQAVDALQRIANQLG